MLFTKLNVGCGPDIKPDWCNMDLVPLPGVNVVHNMMNTPWPFQDNSMITILASHVLEHVPHSHETGRDGFIAIMEEIHRILKPNGILIVRIPHHLNRHALEIDPTHTRVIHPETWDYFSNKPNTLNWYSNARFEVVFQEVTAWRIPRFQPFPYLAWRFKFMRRFGWFGEMTYHLRAIKN